MVTRRALITSGILAAALPAAMLRANPAALQIIAAPSNLGLRPPAPGHEPGTWRAPAALLDAGLLEALGQPKVRRLVRPTYRFEAQAGTRVRNGLEIHRFSESLAEEVANILFNGGFPLVLGGDCSILLGSLLGARRSAVCGLLHVDGHSDFSHPGNYDAASTLRAAAGMDLALASGRGETLLTNWGTGLTPLVADEHIVQIGEREDQDPDYAYPDIRKTRIRRINVRTALRQGMVTTAGQAIEHFEVGSLRRIWLHVDVDVLDQRIMPAVDSPGSPGLSFDQLVTLIKLVRASGIITGADISVFDPELDPDGRYARQLARSLGQAFA